MPRRLSWTSTSAHLSALRASGSSLLQALRAAATSIEKAGVLEALESSGTAAPCVALALLGVAHLSRTPLNVELLSGLLGGTGPSALQVSSGWPVFSWISDAMLRQPTRPTLLTERLRPPQRGDGRWMPTEAPHFFDGLLQQSEDAGQQMAKVWAAVLRRTVAAHSAVVQP